MVFLAGIGDPVFDKLDASLAKAIFSIGAVKGFEIGDGFAAATARGSENNDSFVPQENGPLTKATNHAGGILGGISDGSPIVFRAAVKPNTIHCTVATYGKCRRRSCRYQHPRTPRSGGCAKSCCCCGSHGCYHYFGSDASKYNCKT